MLAAKFISVTPPSGFISLPALIPWCPSLTLCLDTRIKARVHLHGESLRLALSSLPMVKQRAPAPVVINHNVSRLSCGARLQPPYVLAQSECVLHAECLFVRNFIRQSAHSAQRHIDLATQGHSHTHPMHTHTHSLFFVLFLQQWKLQRCCAGRSFVLLWAEMFQKCVLHFASGPVTLCFVYILVWSFFVRNLSDNVGFTEI